MSVSKNTCDLIAKFWAKKICLDLEVVDPIIESNIEKYVLKKCTKYSQIAISKNFKEIMEHAKAYAIESSKLPKGNDKKEQ